MNLREIAAQQRQDVPLWTARGPAVNQGQIKPAAGPRPRRSVSLPTLGLFVVPVGLVCVGAALGYAGGRAIGAPRIGAGVGAVVAGYGLYRYVEADFPRPQG